MLSHLIHFSLRNRFVVLVVAVLVLAFGLRATTTMPVDVLPELTRPTVTLLTEAPGFDAELVEKLVTVPIENEVNGTPGTWRLRSSSDVGLSVVWVEFDWGTDILKARQLVAERLSQTQLPEDIQPVMGPIGSLLGEIMIVGLYSEDGKTAPMELRELADWNIARRLKSVQGVSNVLPIGGGIKQYQVMPDPAKVASFGLTMEQVVEATRAAVDTSTANYIVGPQHEYVVINDAMSTDLNEIGRTVVAEVDGSPVRLEDVASLGFGPQIMRGDAMMGNSPAVLMSVEKSPGTNTLKLTESIEKALEEMRPGLPPGVKLEVQYRQASYIETAVHNLIEALRDGAIFVAIILILFLLNVRTTILTLLAIPLSFAVAALVFSWMGLGINSMTLGGLAVAVGMVVDDAIVDVENVFRRLGENRKAGNPRPALDVVADASQEVRGSILYATLLIVLVFVPLLFLPDIAGKMFQPIALATIISLTASFIVSLTVVPALASMLLPGMKSLHERESWVLKFFKWISRRFLLPASLNHPWITLVTTVVLLAGSIALWPLMGKGFLPPLNEGSATVTLSAAPGTSLENTRSFAVTGARLLEGIEGVEHAALRMGRAENAEHIVGVNTAEWDVGFDTSKRTTEEIMGEIRQKMAQIPGTIVAVGAPISHRIDHMVAGVEAHLVIKLFGEDLQRIRTSAEELAAVFRQVPGATDVRVEQQLLVPVVRVRIDRDKAEAQDLAVEEITSQVSQLVGGEVVGEVLDGQRRFDVFLRLPENLRGDPDEIGSILINDGHGHVLPLREVADVVFAKAPNVVSREAGQRRIIIAANTSGRSVSEVEADMRKAAEGIALPEGSFLTWEGQAAQQRATTQTIAGLSGLVLLAMTALLYSHFRSWSLVMQVMINLPLAFMGGLIANYFLVGELSIASLIGFITLAGIAARNTIMMLSHYLHLVEHEGEGWTREMVVRGSLERIAPVLMTALTAGLALIPLVLAADAPGKEILHPLAVVIVGGLVSSTLLDMIVTPTVFYHFGMPRKKVTA